MASWERETTFHHKWETVVLSALHKYPNPFNGNVVSTDAVERHLDPKSGALCSRKLISTQWAMFPQVSGFMYANENSVIHPQQRRMIMETVNLTLTSIISAHERMEYTVHPENPNWTLLRQTTTIDTPAWFRGKFKTVCLENAAKGCEAIEWVVRHRLPQVTSELSETLSSAIPKAMCESAAATSTPSLDIRPIATQEHRPFWRSLFNAKRLPDSVKDEHFYLL